MRGMCPAPPRSGTHVDAQENRATDTRAACPPPPKLIVSFAVQQFDPSVGMGFVRRKDSVKERRVSGIAELNRQEWKSGLHAGVHPPMLGVEPPTPRRRDEGSGHAFAQ
jgi:hypothetical protein